MEHRNEKVIPAGLFLKCLFATDYFEGWLRTQFYLSLHEAAQKRIKWRGIGRLQRRKGIPYSLLNSPHCNGSPWTCASNFSSTSLRRQKEQEAWKRGLDAVCDVAAGSILSLPHFPSPHLSPTCSKKWITLAMVSAKYSLCAPNTFSLWSHQTSPLWEYQKIHIASEYQQILVQKGKKFMSPLFFCPSNSDQNFWSR